MTYCSLPQLRETTRREKIGSSTDSDDRSSRLGCCGEKVVLGEKFDHEAIEQPRLLDLTGMAGSRQRFQFTIGHEFLKGKGALVGVVFATAENNHRAGDAFMMALGVRR